MRKRPTRVSSTGSRAAWRMWSTSSTRTSSCSAEASRKRASSTGTCPNVSRLTSSRTVSRPRCGRACTGRLPGFAARPGSGRRERFRLAFAWLADRRRELLEKALERLLRPAVRLAQDANAPLLQHRLVDRARPQHEHVGLGAILLVARCAPGLPEAMEHEADVEVGHAVADEQDRLAERIGAELDVERRLEGEPVEVIGLGDDDGLV